MMDLALVLGWGRAQMAPAILRGMPWGPAQPGNLGTAVMSTKQAPSVHWLHGTVQFSEALGSTCLSQELLHHHLISLLLHASAGWSSARLLTDADIAYENKGSVFLMHQKILLKMRKYLLWEHKVFFALPRLLCKPTTHRSKLCW